MTARERLLDAISFTETANMGTTPDALLDDYRTELAEEFAAALLAVDPVEWALAGQHAGRDAAKLIRRMADTAAPTSKEPQR